MPFETLRQYQTGLYSTGIFPADFDGDGDIDLAVSNRGTNNVSILYNNGNGVYETRINFPTGEVPRYVHGGDFDSDGDIDLCTPDYIGMTETVLLNDGNGAFTIGGQYEIETPAFSWVDDIDGDGHLDILITNWDGAADVPSQSPAQFTPLLNNGDGTFVFGPSSVIGKQPRCGASADLNGDGIKDAVIANYWSSSLSVVMGLGKRQWADEVSIELSGHPRYLVLEDLDKDGTVDIAAVDKGEDNLWIFHNDGQANFTLVETLNTNATPHSIDATDMNHDGAIDLVVSHVGSGQQLLFFNDGDGFFPDSQTVILTAGPAEIKIADVNNDGDYDLVSANVNWEERGASVIMQGSCDDLVADCNSNGIEDICELPDCNLNGIPDDCDISLGNSLDFDGDSVPDECQVDCNDNLIPDTYEISQGLVTDCNENEIPDDCDWVVLGDCDEDGILDGCEEDINEDWVPDDCQCNADFSNDGVVGVQDVIALISAWGENPIPHGDPVDEDLNVDNVVDVEDLLILIISWGECSVYTLPDVLGACCLQMQQCSELHEVGCYVRNGVYFGDNTSCGLVDCAAP
ncbi:MAG: VCBS repeat-containing protein [Phycisphaerales bacterium]|nr:VCBS repeat-containing protein [Phycisphaerales bacterium]